MDGNYPSGQAVTSDALVLIARWWFTEKVPAIKRVDPSERAKVLYVRVSERTHRQAQQAADDVGMSIGEWTRWVVEKEVGRDSG